MIDILKVSINPWLLALLAVGFLAYRVSIVRLTSGKSPDSEKGQSTIDDSRDNRRNQ